MIVEVLVSTSCGHVSNVTLLASDVSTVARGIHLRDAIAVVNTYGERSLVATCNLHPLYRRVSLEVCRD